MRITYLTDAWLEEGTGNAGLNSAPINVAF